jgi:hypothetical protein
VNISIFIIVLASWYSVRPKYSSRISNINRDNAWCSSGVWAGEIDDRVSTNCPIHVELANGACRELWIKGYFNEFGRNYRHAGWPEAMFYRQVAPTTDIRTLHAVYAGVDTDTFDNAIVTEDVLGQGAVLLDSLSPYTPDQAAQSLEQLAILHAATWMRPDLANERWADNRLTLYTDRRGVADIDVNFDGPIGAGAPESVRDSQRLYDAYKVLAASITDEEPWTLIHGDSHIGNVYLDAEGRPCFLDWQLAQRAPWYLDVGYHIAAVLTVDDRRANEQALVEHYLGHLAARGVEAPSGDAVWHGLRRGFVHGFFLWAITLKVYPPKTLALIERLGTAVADHAGFGAIG